MVRAIRAQLAYAYPVPPPKSSFVLLADRKGRILCVTRGPGSPELGLPGGQALPGERPADTAVREAKEETGLLVWEPKLLYRDTTDTGRDTSVFRARWTGTVRASSEGDVLWAPLLAFLSSSRWGEWHAQRLSPAMVRSLVRGPG